MHLIIVYTSRGEGPERRGAARYLRPDVINLFYCQAHYSVIRIMQPYFYIKKNLNVYKTGNVILYKYFKINLKKNLHCCTRPTHLKYAFSKFIQIYFFSLKKSKFLADKYEHNIMRGVVALKTRSIFYTCISFLFVF
jgi:hypothetical protein